MAHSIVRLGGGSVVAIGAVAALAGALASVAPVAVAVTVPLIFLVPLVAFRLSLRTIGLWLFAMTLATRLRVPYVGLLPEQLALIAVVGVLLVRGRLDVIIRAIRLMPVSLWLFVVWASVISALRSPDPIASLRIVSWIAASVLIACVVVTTARRSRAQHRPDIASFTVIAALSASIGVLAWLAASLIPGTTIGVQTESLTGAPAAFGLSFEANIFGGICAIWLVIDVLYVERSAAATGTLVRVALGLGVVVSLTRAAVIGALVGLAIGAVANRRTRRVGASVLLGGLIIMGALLSVGPAVPALRPIADKGAQLVDFDSSTSVVRRQSWDLAVADLDLRGLIVGSGVNSFGQRHEDPSRPSERVPGYLGNLFLQLVYDVGLVGATLLGAAALRVLARLPHFDTRAIGVIACATVVSAATSPLWFANWWVIAALAAAASHQTRVRSLPSISSATQVPDSAPRRSG